MKAQTVATFLSDFGVPVGSYTESDRRQSGRVDVNAEVWIDITSGIYLEVHLQVAQDQFVHYGAKTSLMEIVTDVQSALKERESGYRVAL